MEDKKTSVINNLTKQLVYFTHGIKIGDLVAHKTDVDLTSPYVVVDIMYDIDTDQAYCECSNTTTQSVAFKMIEVAKLEAEEDDNA